MLQEIQHVECCNDYLCHSKNQDGNLGPIIYFSKTKINNFLINDKLNTRVLI
jgi:hypothetical protein